MDAIGHVYFTASSEEAQNISLNGFGSVCVELNINGEEVAYDGLYIGKHLDDAMEAVTAERPVLLRFNVDSVAEIFDFVDLDSSVHGADQFAIALNAFTIPAVEFEYFNTLTNDWDDIQTFTIDLSEPVAETALEPAPAKKVHDTPYVPRGQWFKMMREQGLLKPREKTPSTAGQKPARSPQQLAAIRGYYARKARQQAA